MRSGCADVLARVRVGIGQARVLDDPRQMQASEIHIQGESLTPPTCTVAL
jgi:hypothetical protein